MTPAHAVMATPRLLLVGSLTRDFIFYPGESPRLDIPGGHALYAAAGAVIWEKRLAIASQVGKRYPSEDWLSLFQGHGLHVAGVRILDHELEQRAVYSYDEELHPALPLVKACLRHKIPFPSLLLGYQPEKDALLTSCGFSPHPLPDLDRIEGAYLCAMPFEYLAQWIAYLYTHGVKRLVATFPKLSEASAEFAQRLSSLEGLEVLIIHERDLQRLFWRLGGDLWEMASFIGRVIPYVVISLSNRRYLLYAAPDGKRWEIPAYSVGQFPIGLEDAFGGGLLAGLVQTTDLRRAVLYGAVSVAFKSESLDPFYCWEVMSDLAASRLEYLDLLVVPL